MAAHEKRFRKRDAILEYLRGTKAHPSAETIYTDLKHDIPDLAMGTVYRNLTHFKNQGQITSVATVKGVERFDANTEPHVHFICSNCDAVIDLHQIEMPRSLDEKISSTAGCKVESCQLTYVGLCGGCQNQ